MTTIRKELNTLKNLVGQIAAKGGKPDILATQEVQQALKDGTITKAQRDVLQRALADGTPEVALVKQRLEAFADMFDQGDTNKSGRSEKSEQLAANKAYEAWIMAASVSGHNQADVDALKAKTITMTTVGQSGKVHHYPISGAGTLLKKLDALLPRGTSSKYDGFHNAQIKLAVKDGKISLADARKITNSYNWTQHKEFSALLADKMMTFEKGARAHIKDFLSGPLPESVQVGGG